MIPEERAAAERRSAREAILEVGRRNADGLGNAQFFGLPIADMDRDEVLAVLYWVIKNPQGSSAVFQAIDKRILEFGRQRK